MKNFSKSQFAGTDPLELLKKAGGFYERRGNGPLVAYAGTYKCFGETKPYVGEHYVNFGMVERHGALLAYLARQLLVKALGELREVGKGDLLTHATGFCAAPEGGKALAVSLAYQGSEVEGCTCDEYIYPRKLSSKRDSPLIFDRHVPEEGKTYWIVDDTYHNGSTIDKMVPLIEKCGASVAGVLCFFNRSMTTEHSHVVGECKRIPLISLVRKYIPQFKQEDKRVVDDVLAGNVYFDPKTNWRGLLKTMGQ